MLEQRPVFNFSERILRRFWFPLDCFAVKETKHEQWLRNAESLSFAKCRTKDLKKMIQVLGERRCEREDIVFKQFSGMSSNFQNIFINDPNKKINLAISMVDLQCTSIKSLIMF